MSGLKKLYPSSTDCNDIRGTPISAINSALDASETTGGLQNLNQLLREQQQSISAIKPPCITLAMLLLMDLIWEMIPIQLLLEQVLIHSTLFANLLKIFARADTNKQFNRVFKAR